MYFYINLKEKLDDQTEGIHTKRSDLNLNIIAITLNVNQLKAPIKNCQ